MTEKQGSKPTFCVTPKRIGINHGVTLAMNVLLTNYSLGKKIQFEDKWRNNVKKERHKLIHCKYGYLW